jgi:DHA1 family bicyclomycin/chloramphenicol resistance-like MFS transporter
MVPTDQAASMIGYVTMGMSIVPMIGPGIGGVLDQAFGWQANFWLLLGLGVAMLYAVYVDLGETLPADRLGAGQSFRAQIRDYPHFASLTALLGLLPCICLRIGRVFRLPRWRAVCGHDPF